MPLLVAAATDQTGRTITMLSAGLVAVAVGLTLLTVWYWRFTSPRRRVVAVEPGAGRHSIEREPATVVGSTVDESSVFESAVVEPIAAAQVVHQSIATGAVPPSTDNSPPSLGFDDDEWAMITQAVLDEYRDS